MELLRLCVHDFGCIEAAEVDFGPGLNVLCGPNDLGKSTLAAAVRHVLLLQHGSSAGRDLVPWGTTRVPRVELTFSAEGQVWRVAKAWGSGTAGSSRLEWSKDGHVFSTREQGRAVDGELRRLLGWGIPEPGGKGGTHGLPKSFLAAVLLGEQATPHAVLDRSLAEDPEGSGRERLSQALQALAQDERFKWVLDRTQARVDEAFTATGKEKRGRSSPFVRIGEEVRRCEDEWTRQEQRVAESEAVSSRLFELDRDRDRLMSAVQEARDRVERIDRDLARGRRAAETQSRLDAAQAVLATIETTRAEVARLQARADALRELLPGHEARATKAAEQRASAEARERRADALRQSAASGGTPAEQLELQRLDHRRLEIEAARERLATQAARARTAVAAGVRAVEAAEQVAALERKLQEAAQRVDSAAEARDRAETHTKRLHGALRLLAVRETEQRVEEAVRAADEVRSLHARAAAERDRAETIEAQLAARELPTAEITQALHDRHDAWRLAEARLGGGLAVRVRLHDADVTVQLRSDDGPLTALPPEGAIEAERRVEVHLGSLATLEVVGGDADARRSFEMAAQAWRDVSAPVLTRAQADDLGGLQALIDGARAERAEAERARHEASTLERLATAQQTAADALPQTQARLDDELRALAEFDRSELEVVLRDVDGPSLRAAAQASTAALRERMADLERARAARSELETTLHIARDQLDTRRREAVVEGVEQDPTTRLTQLEAEDAQLEAQLQSAEQERVAVQATRIAAARAAAAAHAEAAAQVEHARAEERQAQQAAAQTRDALASCEGALAVRREAAERSDPEAAAADVARLQAELDALPVPTGHADEAQLAAACHALAEHERALEEAVAEVRKQEGALQQVGGDVVRERAHAAREALEAARRREADTALEYHAWSLLLEALREAETAEGRHLGETLGREIAERFGRLTRGRYGGLALGPDLQTEGLHTSSGVQPTDSLSEGLKEQLATILRVSVAEQLRGSLVLDDHLTQTDLARIGWFRELLRAASAQIQIVVLTCRPDDYLDSAEQPASPASFHHTGDRLHAIDLARVIRRFA